MKSLRTSLIPCEYDEGGKKVFIVADERNMRKIIFSEGGFDGNFPWVAQSTSVPR